LGGNWKRRGEKKGVEKGLWWRRRREGACSRVRTSDPRIRSGRHGGERGGTKKETSEGGGRDPNIGGMPKDRKAARLWVRD